MNTNQIDGFKNEYEISNYLNHRKIKYLDPLFSDMIDQLYGKLDDDLLIKAYIDKEKKKFDLVIEINHIVKRVSIKKGICNSVHVEGISSFIHFLIDSGVEKDVVVAYLKYHYADGTTNGSGITRLPVWKYKIEHQNDIDYINSKINNPYVLKRAIQRFVLQGKNSNILIDGLLYGVVGDFFFVTKDDIMKILESEKNEVMKTGVHFGNLYCQPMTRNLNRNPLYEKKRYCVQIKWYSIFDDILEYKNRIYKKDVSNVIE